MLQNEEFGTGFLLAGHGIGSIGLDYALLSETAEACNSS
jgi:hypothetical protein